jgi:dTMP kinase
MERWAARAEVLLFAAARADHLEKTIVPALDAGRWVLSDRFLDSSLAYQGGAGGLGIETVRAINAFALDGWYPDRTLILGVENGSERARARDGGESDRIGGRPDDYHRKVEAAFRIIAAEEPERVKLVDASGSPEQVTERLLEALADLLP